MKLTGLQIDVIWNLGAVHHALRAGEIASQLGLKGGMVTGALNGLWRRGLVKTALDPAGEVVYQLTEKGRALWREVDAER